MDELNVGAQRWSEPAARIGRVPLPPQVAPVDRTPGSAARNGGSGVEASAWWDDVIRVASTVAPAVLSAL